jgi:hypothetical protein
MSASALTLGLLGVAASFAPQEIVATLGLAPARLADLLVQVIGGLYLGFAMLNWMARGSVMGGIYGRPFVMANLLHFVSAGLAIWSRVPELSWLWALVAVYLVFAIGFGLILFRQPSRHAT